LIKAANPDAKVKFILDPDHEARRQRQFAHKMEEALIAYRKHGHLLGEVPEVTGTGVGVRARTDYEVGHPVFIVDFARMPTDAVMRVVKARVSENCPEAEIYYRVPNTGHDFLDISKHVTFRGDPDDPDVPPSPPKTDLSRRIRACEEKIKFKVMSLGVHMIGEGDGVLSMWAPFDASDDLMEEIREVVRDCDPTVPIHLERQHVMQFTNYLRL